MLMSTKSGHCHGIARFLSILSCSASLSYTSICVGVIITGCLRAGAGRKRSRCAVSSLVAGNTNLSFAERLRGKDQNPVWQGCKQVFQVWEKLNTFVVSGHYMLC